MAAGCSWQANGQIGLKWRSLSAQTVPQSSKPSGYENIPRTPAPRHTRRARVEGASPRLSQQRMLLPLLRAGIFLDPVRGRLSRPMRDGTHLARRNLPRRRACACLETFAKPITQPHTMDKPPLEFDFKAITHAAVFTLTHGGELTIARNPTGVFLSGKFQDIQKSIAFSNEAAEIVISALLASRADNHEPLPFAELLPYDANQ